MFGMISLNQNATLQIAASGASGDLREKLKSSFGGTKIGHCKSVIHRNYTDERYIRKIVSFGEHLRSDEHIEFAFAERRQRFFEFVFTRNRIAVNSGDSQIWKFAAHNVFDLFRAFTDEKKKFAFAVRTFFRCFFLVITVMTNKLPLAFMISQSDVAIVTANRFAARSAQDETRKSAPIQENNWLFAAFVRFFDGFDKLRRKYGVFSFRAENFTHINEFRRRHRTISDAVRQTQIFIFSNVWIVKSFERRRCRA